MKTNRAPWDYERPIVIVSQKIKLCRLCGGHVFYMPNNVYRCIDCRTVGKFDEIEEADAEFYRQCLAKKQEDDAVLLALSMLPQMVFVSDCVNMVADITPETEAEMNCWIVEEISFTLDATDPQPDEGTDNRASTQWKEHGYY